MPELPDLVRVERLLGAALQGRRITAVRIGDPTVLRIMVREPFPACLVGRTVEAVARRGHFMRFALSGGLDVVVNAMLAGRYHLAGAPGAGRMPKTAALALDLDGGVTAAYADDKRMGKVYVVAASETGPIPGYGDLGVDVLSPALTRERFRALVAKRRDQVRVFLMDKRALASIGNAYADEILHAARLHPKTLCRQLASAQVDALHDAVGRVLRAAVDEIERRGEPVEVKVRDFLAVRGRAGKPCRACGATLRAVRVGGGDACFCPRCQPAARKLFVDWGKLPG